MLSKEEILEKAFGPKFQELFGEWAKDQWLHFAMDEYAKQEAIEFAKFATDVALGKIDVPFKNDTELYQQYLNSKANAK